MLPNTIIVFGPCIKEKTAKIGIKADKVILQHDDSRPHVACEAKTYFRFER